MTRTLRLGADPARNTDPEQVDTEVKMRRALGLPVGGGRPPAGERGGAPARSTGRNRVAELEQQLETEQRAAAQVKKELEAARAAHRDLETRLHHIGIARDEALAALEVERKARAEIEGRMAALRVLESMAHEAGARDAHPDAPADEPPAHHGERAQHGPAQFGEDETAPAAATLDASLPPPPRRRGRPPGRRTTPQAAPAQEESEPVQWWLPGWKER